MTITILSSIRNTVKNFISLLHQNWCKMAYLEPKLGKTFAATLIWWYVEPSNRSFFNFVWWTVEPYADICSKKVPFHGAMINLIRKLYTNLYQRPKFYDHTVFFNVLFPRITLEQTIVKTCHLDRVFA